MHRHQCDSHACPEYNELTRRDFLARATAAAIVAASPAWLPRVAYAQAEDTARDVIISIFLRGGADGLSLVPPHAENAYYALRPTINVPRPDSAFESQCLANLAGDCLKNRVGAAFFASPDDGPDQAQFVLTYGVIDSLLRYDSPYGDPIDLAEAQAPVDGETFDVERGTWSQTMITKTAHEVLVGSPSADFLPPETAAALCGFLEQAWGLADPRVELLIDMKLRPHRILVVGRKRSEFPEGSDADHAVRTLLWFLPPSRTVMLMPEDGSRDRMLPLRSLFEGG